MSPIVLIAIGAVVLLIVAVLALRPRGSRRGENPLAPGDLAVSTSAAASPVSVTPTKAAAKAAAGARTSVYMPGDTLLVNGAPWQVAAVYAYAEGGDTWDEWRLQGAGGTEAWLAREDAGHFVLYDRAWPAAQFPTQASARMPDGQAGTRNEAGTAAFNATGTHDGWPIGDVSYATYRTPDGRLWSFELHDGEEVEAWSGAQAEVRAQ